MRVPHHANPFANLYGLGFWLHGIIATVGLFLAFALLAGRVNQTLRPLVIWLAALLAYLLLAVVISAFDTRTGILGAFLPFRPSALILLFCVVTLLLTVRSLAVDESAALCDTLIRCAFIALVPVFLWDGAKESVKALTLRPAYADVREVIGFIDSHAGPGDVVLTDPDLDMKPLGADLPRLIPRPSLVSFKYVPNTPADIYRWWDLLEFRKKVYRGECPQSRRSAGTFRPLRRSSAGRTARLRQRRLSLATLRHRRTAAASGLIAVGGAARPAAAALIVAARAQARWCAGRSRPDNRACHPDASAWASFRPPRKASIPRGRRRRLALGRRLRAASPLPAWAEMRCSQTAPGRGGQERAVP